MAEGMMPKAYDHRPVEERLYNYWLERGYFTPQIDWSKKPFVMSMPPPNVTGELHHGHAMVMTFQDLMIRWRRMQGYAALWLPGTDHAGIATQNVVEEELAKEGLTRHELGREAFVERVWQWKERCGRIITEQIKRMGASCDWTRERFTLDEGLSRAVREAFVRLYKKGLIYRGYYLVNWCPRCATALSDLEVEHQETAGQLYYVRYPLADGAEPGHITVATTRPETILGDTAVAVHPQDKRYASLVGHQAVLPALGRLIPIVADEAVDPAFGTGAVKVTPAHDPTDYEIGQRHGLPALNVMNPDGTMNAAAGKYAGLDRYACRQALLQDLKAAGLLVKTEGHAYALGHCSRCDTVVEPTLSEQWFVRIKPLADPAIAAVRDGRIRIIPERFAKVYFNWMENIRDWCISRQLWWGHRIPVWYCDGCGEVIAAPDEPAQCPRCGGGNLRQDPDVLDTWFSSGLWPFSTLGWPDNTEDLRYFYPTTVMETGYDILFFWVARMIMMGLECAGDVPFREVYLHGLMRDEKGEKMSKSKGNVANPLTVIAQYGADALRFTIATGGSAGSDMKLSEDRLEGNRNFANKLWNAARFVVQKAGDFRPEIRASYLGPGASALEDRWIISRTQRTMAEVTRLLEEYQFGEAGRLIHEFLWGEYCDWYIELAKIRLRNGDATALPVLVGVLHTALKLLHPFMPFVTEEIWQHLMRGEGKGEREEDRGEKGEQATSPPSTLSPQPSTLSPQPSLMVQPWPQPGPTDEAAERDMGLVIDLIRAIRNARAEYRVEAGRWIEALVVAGDTYHELVTAKEEAIAWLARIRPLRLTRTLADKPAQALVLIVGPLEVYLPLAGLVDPAQEQERLAQEIAQISQEIERRRARLAQPAFAHKAPPPVVERERQKLAEQEARRAKLKERLAGL